MDRIFITLLFLTVILMPSQSFADLVLPPSDPRDVIDTVLDMTEQGNLTVHNTTYFRLCEIRRIFCGVAKTALLAVAIFTMGILVLIGKASWTQVIVICIGAVIFSSAELVMIRLTTLPPSIGVIYSCYCLDTMQDIAIGAWDFITNW